VANTTPHKLENCFAFGNPSMGFTRNNNPSAEISCTNCGAWSNGKGGFAAEIKQIGEIISLPAVTPAIAIAVERDSLGYLPVIKTLVSSNLPDYLSNDKIITITKIPGGFVIRRLDSALGKSDLIIYDANGKKVAYQNDFKHEYILRTDCNFVPGLYLLTIVDRQNQCRTTTKKIYID
jgi:hypothetical protein